jgi:hypothetical protein
LWQWNGEPVVDRIFVLADFTQQDGMIFACGNLVRAQMQAVRGAPAFPL